MLTHDDIIKIIHSNSNHIEIKKSNFDDDLNSIGLDSLDVFTVLLEIQEKSGVEIPEDAISQCNTVNNIFNYINKK